MAISLLLTFSAASFILSRPMVRRAISPATSSAIERLGLRPVVSRWGPGTRRVWAILRRVRNWVSLTLSALLVMGVSFLLLAEDLFPYALPRVTLTNGDQVVVFESMIHIGSPRFYDEVRADIEAERSAGGTYMYEGIRPCTDPARAEAFASRVSNGALPEGLSLGRAYRALAEGTGLILQPQSSFKSDGDVNADASCDDLWPLLPEPQAAPDGEHIDQGEIDHVFSQISSISSRFPHWMVRVGKHLARNVIRVILADQEETHIPNAAVVLDSRNRVLADHILHGPPRIIVTYGFAHLPGLLQDLQQADPRWHETDIVMRRVLQ